MDRENVINQIVSATGYRLFCLVDLEIHDGHELRELARDLNQTDRFRQARISIGHTRAKYIRQHQHEGQFFQQRYQASYNDHGETVGERIARAASKFPHSHHDGWIRKCKLEALIEKPLLQLSSGEWQRFSICEMLIGQPDILLIPDLLKGLDRVWQTNILDVVKAYSGLVIFTHDRRTDDPHILSITRQGHEAIPATHFIRLPTEIIDQFHRYQSDFLPDVPDLVQIEMQGVNIQYGQLKILNDINWTVHAGEKWNIQGPNGAGKSTLISLINSDNPQGYSQPLRLFGHKYGSESMWERKARISYFGSDFFQYFQSGKTVEETFTHLLKTPYLKTVQPPEDLVSSLFAWFDLSKDLDLPFSAADRDTRRQILLLATYLKSSEVLILDEPYQDFSTEKINQNNHFLDSLQDRSNQTVIFVTHRDDHKPRFLNQILILDLVHENLNS